MPLISLLIPYKPIVKNPVKVYGRKWRVDARGALAEILRSDDAAFENFPDFGQAYVTTIRPHITKAWHMHKNQTDRMFLLKGIVHFGVVTNADCKKDVFVTALSLVVDSKDPKLIVIPPTYYHGFKNIGNEDAYVLNIPNEKYLRNKPDEHRMPYNSFGRFWSVSYNG